MVWSLCWTCPIRIFFRFADSSLGVDAAILESNPSSRAEGSSQGWSEGQHGSADECSGKYDKQSVIIISGKEWQVT